MTSSSYFITTTIPYVNGQPHIGHALEYVQADALTRWLKSKGHHVILQTGTDDNALKNLHSAQTLGVTPQEFVDQNAQTFQDLCQKLNIQYDHWVRTSSEAHQRGVYDFWQRLYPEDLYKKKYSGLYCYGCEDFYKEEDLIQGLCPDHKVAPTLIEEENLFFKLSRYQGALYKIIQSDQIRIEPLSRKKEVLSFIKRGLQDISVSRSRQRSQGWGIPVPGVPDQVIYVWIEALTNYITGAGLGTHDHWKELWSEKVQKIHCIGKNVWKFHAIYWPALLLSAKLPLPNQIYVHGFLTENGSKISKSLGVSLDPIDLVNQYGSDAVRFYLLQNFNPYQDGDFSILGLQQVYNQYLANGLGNLLSRLVKLKQLAQVGDIPLSAVVSQNQAEGPFEFSRQIEHLWQRIHQINCEITQVKPWEKIKSGSLSEVEGWIKKWWQEFYGVSGLLSPYLPEGSKTLHEVLRSTSLSNHSALLYPRR